VLFALHGHFQTCPDTAAVAAAAGSRDHWDTGRGRDCDLKEAVAGAPTETNACRSGVVDDGEEKVTVWLINVPVA
jgi:hypothetical protein